MSRSFIYEGFIEMQKMWKLEKERFGMTNKIAEYIKLAEDKTPVCAFCLSTDIKTRMADTDCGMNIPDVYGYCGNCGAKKGSGWDSEAALKDWTITESSPFPAMAKALLEAEEAMKDAEKALYFMNIPENGPERRQLKEALSKIQNLKEMP
jgi:hypothetical protein